MTNKLHFDSHKNRNVVHFFIICFDINFMFKLFLHLKYLHSINNNSLKFTGLQAR